MNLPFCYLCRLLGTLLLSACLAITSATTFAADDLPKAIAARLAPRWLADAKQIRTPEHVIYYRGSARGGVAPDGKHWAGVIEGEILVLTPTMANACPKVRLDPTGSISVEGASHMKVVDDAPPWKKLLQKGK
jgi:hypothetical protein